MKTFRELLENINKQHEKYLKIFIKGKNLKDLYKKYLSKGLIAKSVDYDEWTKYMNNEIKARKTK